MTDYEHECKYYETDQMGIIHHSNYIRFMEEARVDFLEKAGFPFDKIEEGGVYSPVVGVTCDYKKMSRFTDVLRIHVSVKEYRGVKLVIQYDMYEKESGELRARGTSSHCFTSKETGKIVLLRKVMPKLDAELKKWAEEYQGEA